MSSEKPKAEIPRLSLKLPFEAVAATGIPRTSFDKDIRPKLRTFIAGGKEYVTIEELKRVLALESARIPS